jgi:hypothetical protein
VPACAAQKRKRIQELVEDAGEGAKAAGGGGGGGSSGSGSGDDSSGSGSGSDDSSGSDEERRRKVRRAGNGAANADPQFVDWGVGTPGAVCVSSCTACCWKSGVVGRQQSTAHLTCMLTVFCLPCVCPAAQEGQQRRQAALLEG